MSKSTVINERKEIPIYDETDVLVVGGGIAGISAALAAVRNGKNVTILEKSCMLGGLATVGHVCIYLPLCDGLGHKVFGGIAEELLHTTIKYSYNTLPKGWDMGVSQLENPQGRYTTHFNIPACIMAFDELMEQEGIKVLFDVVFSEPIMDCDVCKGVIVESKQGRVALLAKMVVDASGDADVLARAGANLVETDSIVSHWCYELNFETMKRGIDAQNILKSTSLRWLGLRPDVDNSNSTIQRFYGTSIEGVNGFLKLSRKLALDYLKKKQYQNYAMMTLPYMAQFRMTRRIAGIKELDMDSPDTYLEDSVGCVCYSLASPAPVYEFPYGGVLDKKLKNIAAAGRIVSAKELGWDLMRLIPACAFTGQVAGTATALAIESGVSLQEVDVKILQKRLEETGVIIHVPNHMKGNKNKHIVTNPKESDSEVIETDALSYH